MIETNTTAASYEKPEVVKSFETASGLHPCEAYTFSKYYKEGQDVLDIGVGGGRTVPYFLPRAHKYLGIDFSKKMIEACRKKYPSADFSQENASDLGALSDSSFDFVVFTFNGISTIPTDEGRMQCLKEVYRVLRPEGIFIFSIANSEGFISVPNLDKAGLAKRAWRTLLAVQKTIKGIFNRLKNGCLFSKSWRMFVSTDGGIHLYAATPQIVERECVSFGFTSLEVVDYSLSNLPKWFVGSYCYVMSK